MKSAKIFEKLLAINSSFIKYSFAKLCLLTYYITKDIVANSLIYRPLVYNHYHFEIRNLLFVVVNIRYVLEVSFITIDQLMYISNCSTAEVYITSYFQNIHHKMVKHLIANDVNLKFLLMFDSLVLGRKQKIVVYSCSLLGSDYK